MSSPTPVTKVPSFLSQSQPQQKSSIQSAPIEPVYSPTPQKISYESNYETVQPQKITYNRIATPPTSIHESTSSTSSLFDQPGGDDDEELLEGWKIAQTTDGALYYYNVNTKESSRLKPLAGLLPNWRQHATADGKMYYVNVKTKEVTYNKPVDDGFSYEDPDELAPPPPVDDIPLPSGWKEASAPDGRTYYFNSSTKQTTWTKPTL